MLYESIAVTPLSPHIGAEVGNIDLTRALSERQQHELRAAFVQHQVVFFRAQHVSADDLVRLGGYLGTVVERMGGRSNSKATDHPLVRKYHFDETSKRIAERVLHSDLSCAPAPPAISVLYNHTLPPDGGGDTLFASMYSAYDALSPRMQAYLEGLAATHDGARSFGKDAPSATHPVIVRHPESGRKAIFVNAEFTTGIEGLPEKEGRHVLQFLFEHCRRDEWTCRFRWQPHSIAVWDNRCTLHKAIMDYWPHVRSGYRIYVQANAASA